MAETPKKKTENAADAPPNSGAAPVRTSAQSEGRAPTARELELQAQIDDLKAELMDRDGSMLKMIDRLGAAIGKGVIQAQHEAKQPAARGPKVKREIPPEFKGAHTYVVGPKGAFQGTRRFVQGEKITIVDQFPSTDWTPLEANDPAPSQPVAKQGRASDQTVG